MHGAERSAADESAGAGETRTPRDTAVQHTAHALHFRQTQVFHDTPHTTQEVLLPGRVVPVYRALLCATLKVTETKNLGSFSSHNFKMLEG